MATALPIPAPARPEVAADLHAHYAALRSWLVKATATVDEVTDRLLDDHARWLLDELCQPGQPRRERLPVAVEASACWRPAGVETGRFIVGATLAALQTDTAAALQRLAETLALPTSVAQSVHAFLARGALPAAVQLGLAHSTQGWSRRLYLEGGTLPVAMHAWQWQDAYPAERVYLPHPVDDLTPLGDVPSEVRVAWQSLVAKGRGQRALLRQDLAGVHVAVHVAVERQPILRLASELQALADALQVPRQAADAWLESLPANTQGTVVALGRDGGLHLNVYVAPDQDYLPQPGPPPGDLRRTPGTVCWYLRDPQTGAWHGWLVFALPNADLPHRPAGRAPGAWVYASSSVPNGPLLAQDLAACLDTAQPSVLARLAAAEDGLRGILARAGLVYQL